MSMPNDFGRVANVGASMDICADANNVLFSRNILPETINTTLPTSSPLRLHATVTNSIEGTVCNAHRMNMTGSSLIWTPQLVNNTASSIEGNSSNLTVFMEPGASIVWIATEIGDGDDNTAYVGMNYTFMTQEMLDQAEAEQDKGNGEMAGKSISLKALMVAALLGMGMSGW